MRRSARLTTLTLVATPVLAQGATAQQMNGEHMMPNGRMMDDSMMASPPASGIVSPSATANGHMMGGHMTASPSSSANTSLSATPSDTATASTMATAPQSHHGGGGSSASAAVGGRLPSTGGVSLVSIGALALLMGFGFAAYRLSRRST